MARQVVIETATGNVLKHGYTDFTPELKPGESILESDFVFEPGLDCNKYHWDGTTFIDDGLRTTLLFLASSTLLHGALAITSDTSWEDLGGVSTNLAYFAKDLAAVIGQAVGEAQAVGTAAELRLVQVVAGVETVLTTTPFAIPVSGTWSPFKFNTDVVPSSGQNAYLLQGRLNGATSAQVRFVSLAAVESTKP